MKRPALHWSLYFASRLVGILIGGALVGAGCFSLVGCFLAGHHWRTDALAGFRHIGFITLIWAPGIALVLTVMRAHRQASQNRTSDR